MCLDYKLYELIDCETGQHVGSFITLGAALAVARARQIAESEVWHERAGRVSLVWSTRPRPSADLWAHQSLPLRGF